MDFRYNRDYFGIFAPKGSGKTFFVKKLLEVIPRAIIIDTNDEYQNTNSNFRIIRPSEYSSEEFDKIMQEIFLNESDATLVIDDIDVYSPMKSKILPMFNSNSRHRGLGLIFVSRRPKKLDPVMILNSDYILLGYPILPQDKKYIESLINFQIPDKYINSLQRYQFILIDIRNRSIQIVYV